MVFNGAPRERKARLRIKVRRQTSRNRKCIAVSCLNLVALFLIWGFSVSRSPWFFTFFFILPYFLFCFVFSYSCSCSSLSSSSFVCFAPRCTLFIFSFCFLVCFTFSYFFTLSSSSSLSTSSSPSYLLIFSLICSASLFSFPLSLRVPPFLILLLPFFLQ